MICPRCGAPNQDGSVLCRGCGALLQASSPDLTSQPTGPIDPLRDVPVVFAPGQSLGERYTVVERIGAGGMGLVYKAIDRRLGKTVALKLIQARAAARPAAQERFRRELALAQQVTHPNVCRVHDLGEVDGTTFISMEYVEGQTLEVLIHSMGHLSPSQTVALGRQICAGLQAIHERGIIHRDLKPGNVMVDRLGHVLLMDFGMAYQKDQDRLTAEGAIFGTLAYLSPEQGRGLADFRSDVYALGLILYEMLTGKRPPGDEGQLPLALRPAEDACPPPSRFSPEVPGTLDAIVMRCLERAAEQRYPSPAALGEALGALGSGVTQTATMHLASLPRPGRARRAWRNAAVLALAVSLAALVTWLAATRWNRANPAAPVGAPIAIALLPLAYEGSPDGAFLKDLVPLTMGADLGRAAGLQVTPFANARAFGPRDDPAAVARQLGVACVVHGQLSVRDGRAEGTLRLQCAGGKEFPAQRLSGSLSELVLGIDALSAALARALGVRYEEAPLRSPAALQAYLEGLAALEGWDVKANASAAQAAFTRALTAQADFAEAYAGRALAQLNEYNVTRREELIEHAWADAQRAVELAPTLPEAHVAVGLVHVWRGRSAQAQAAFERAASLAPADDAIFRRIGVAYSRNNRRDDADRMFARAIKLRPTFWDNHNAAGIHYLQTGRLALAKQAYREVITLRAESTLGYANLAAVLLLQGELSEAEPVLLAGLRVGETPNLRLNLGFVYDGLGRHVDAIVQIQRAIDLGDRSSDAFGALADALRHAGREGEASRAYETAIGSLRQRVAVDATDAEALAKLGMYLAGAGRCPEALPLAGRVSRADLHYYATVAFALCDRHAAAVRSALAAAAAGLPGDIRSNVDLRAVAADARVRAALEQLDGVGAKEVRGSP